MDGSEVGGLVGDAAKAARRVDKRPADAMRPSFFKMRRFTAASGDLVLQRHSPFREYLPMPRELYEPALRVYYGDYSALDLTPWANQRLSTHEKIRRAMFLLAVEMASYAPQSPRPQSSQEMSSAALKS